MDDAFPIDKLDCRDVSGPVTDEVMDLRPVLPYPDVFHALDDIFDRFAVIELILDPLDFVQRRPFVRGRIYRFIEPHDLDHEALLVHPAVRKLPSELVEGDAAIL